MYTPIVKLSTVLILSLYTSFSGCQNVIYKLDPQTQRKTFMIIQILMV